MIQLAGMDHADAFGCLERENGFSIGLSKRF